MARLSPGRRLSLCMAHVFQSVGSRSEKSPVVQWHANPGTSIDADSSPLALQKHTLRDGLAPRLGLDQCPIEV